MFDFFKTLFPKKFVVLSDNGFITSLIDKFFEFIYSVFNENFFSVVLAVLLSLTIIIWTLRNVFKGRMDAFYNLKKISFSNPLITIIFLGGFFYFLFYPVTTVLVNYEGNGKIKEVKTFKEPFLVVFPRAFITRFVYGFDAFYYDVAEPIKLTRDPEKFYLLKDMEFAENYFLYKNPFLELKRYLDYVNFLKSPKDDLIDKNIGRDFYTKYSLTPISMLINANYQIANGLQTNKVSIFLKNNMWKNNADADTLSDYYKMNSDLDNLLKKYLDYGSDYIFTNYFSNVRLPYIKFMQAQEKIGNTLFSDDKLYFDTRYLMQLLIKNLLEYNNNAYILGLIKNAKTSSFLEKYFISNDDKYLNEYYNSTFYKELKNIYSSIPDILYKTWKNLYNFNYAFKPDYLVTNFSKINKDSEYASKSKRIFTSQFVQSIANIDWQINRNYFKGNAYGYIFLSNYDTTGTEKNLLSSSLEEWMNDEETGNEKTQVFESISSKKLFNFFKALEANLFTSNNIGMAFEKEQKLDEVFKIINSSDPAINFGLVGQVFGYTDLTYNEKNSNLYFSKNIELKNELFNSNINLKHFKEFSNIVFNKTKDKIALYIKNSYNNFVIPLIYQDFVSTLLSSNVSPILGYYFYSNKTSDYKPELKYLLDNLYISKDDDGNFILDDSIKNKKTKGLYTIDYLIKDWSKLVKIENPTVKQTTQLSQMVLFNINALRRLRNILQDFYNKEHGVGKAYVLKNAIVTLNKKIQFYNFLYLNMINENGDLKDTFDIYQDSNLLYTYFGFLRYFTSLNYVAGKNNIYLFPTSGSTGDYLSINEIKASEKKAIEKNYILKSPEMLPLSFYDINIYLLNIATSVNIEDFVLNSDKNLVENGIYENAFYILSNFGIKDLNLFKDFFAIPENYQNKCPDLNDDFYKNSWSKIYDENKKSYSKEEFDKFFNKYLNCIQNINKDIYNSIKTSIDEKDFYATLFTVSNIKANETNDNLLYKIITFLVNSMDYYYTSFSEHKITKNNFSFELENAMFNPNKVITSAYPNLSDVVYFKEVTNYDNIEKIINSITSLDVVYNDFISREGVTDLNKFFNNLGVAYTRSSTETVTNLNLYLYSKILDLNKMDYMIFKRFGVLNYGNERNFNQTFSNLFINKENINNISFITAPIVTGAVIAKNIPNIKKALKSTKIKISEYIFEKRLGNIFIKKGFKKVLTLLNPFNWFKKTKEIVKGVLLMFVLIGVLLKFILIVASILIFIFYTLYKYFYVYYVEIILPIIITSVTLFINVFLGTIKNIYIKTIKSDYSVEEYSEISHKLIVDEVIKLFKYYMLYLSFNALFNLSFHGLVLLSQNFYLSNMFSQEHYIKNDLSDLTIILLILLISILFTVSIVGYIGKLLNVEKFVEK